MTPQHLRDMLANNAAQAETLTEMRHVLIDTAVATGLDWYEIADLLKESPGDLLARHQEWEATRAGHG